MSNQNPQKPFRPERNVVGNSPLNPSYKPQPSLPDPGQAEYRQTTQRPVAVVNMPQSAWQSLPSAVRFAIWLWTISVIVGFVGAIIMGVLFALGMGLALS